MKGFCILFVFLIVPLAMLADDLKYITKRLEITCFPFDCTESSPSSHPLYFYLGDSIVVDSGYIDPFYVDNLRFSPFLYDTAVVKSKGGSYAYVVKLSNCVENLHDPGCFRIIDIESGGRNLLGIRQSDGWDTLRNDARKYASNPYFLTVPVSKTSTALIFTGYPYTSSPELVTIVLLNKDRAALVFNRKMIVRNIEYTKDTFVMDLQDIMFEYIDSLVPVNTPQLYRIFKEDGVLKFGGPYGILKD